MYSSQFCPYCLGAQRLLNAKEVEFTIHSVDGDPHKRREMMDRGGGYTLPQVFINGRPVGGFDELLGLARQSSA